MDINFHSSRILARVLCSQGSGFQLAKKKFIKTHTKWLQAQYLLYNWEINISHTHKVCPLF